MEMLNQTFNKISLLLLANFAFSTYIIEIHIYLHIIRLDIDSSV